MGFVALPVFGCLDIFELIVKYASDKNHIRNYKMTPLQPASYKGNLKIRKLLIHETAEKRPQDNQGMTPLHFAAKYGPLEICKILMDPKNQEKE